MLVLVLVLVLEKRIAPTVRRCNAELVRSGSCIATWINLRATELPRHGAWRNGSFGTRGRVLERSVTPQFEDEDDDEDENELTDHDEKHSARSFSGSAPDLRNSLKLNAASLFDNLRPEESVMSGV